MARYRVPLAAVVAIVLVGVPVASLPAVSAAAGATYYLPAPTGTQLVVTQGQNTPLDHNATNHSLYAWDFGISGNAEFNVTAVRAGTVIGLRDNSEANCYSGGNDWSCWKDANYALVDHGDGTSALYVHLAYGSAAIKVGDHVVAGQKLAKDDNTGFSSANHLHFMVETTPTVPNTPAPGPTDKTSVAWWWTNSLSITFSDTDVLAKDPDGIPKYLQSLTSGAPAAIATPPAYGQLAVSQSCVKTFSWINPPNPPDQWYIPIVTITYTGTPAPRNMVGIFAAAGSGYPSVSPRNGYGGVPFGSQMEVPVWKNGAPSDKIYPGDPVKAYLMVAEDPPGSEAGKPYWVAWAPVQPNQPTAVRFSIRKCP